MIWTYIYDFLIIHLFGGVTSDMQFVNGAFVSYVYDPDTSGYNAISTYDVGIDLFNRRLPLGNYLSMICTIIIMALIVWFAIWLTIWVFKLVSHAFLLK